MRDFEEAKKQSALKRARFLNCSLVVFVLFSSLSCVVVVVRISRSGVLLLLLTYSISARSRGFYRANKNSILSVKKNVLNTHTRTCVREFSSGAFSRALKMYRRYTRARAQRSDLAKLFSVDCEKKTFLSERNVLHFLTREEYSFTHRVERDRQRKRKKSQRQRRT